jgi:beta-lactamase regulating signal transducer with metallopeptidase domain
VGTTDAVLTFVFNALWQVPLVAAGTGAVAWLWPRASARDRSALLLAAILLSVVVPAASVVRASRHSPEAVSWAVSLHAGAPLSLPVLPRVAAPFRADTADTLALAFSVFVAARLLVIVRAWLACRRLLRGAAEAPCASTLRWARACAARFGLGDVPVRVAAGTGAPLTVGAWRPVIVLPRAVENGPEDAVRAALGHEMAHVQRRDFAWNLAVQILCAPVSFHPAWWVLARRLQAARESACDEQVCVAWMPWRRYARALVHVAASITAARRPVAAMGFWGSSLEERIMRLREGRRRGSPVFRMAGAAVLSSSLAAGTAFAVAVDGGQVESALARVESVVAAGERKVRELVAADPEGPALYQPAGRRDPFQRYAVPPESSIPEGPPRYRIAEVALRGIVSTPQGRTALIWAPSQKTYFVRVGQRFFDGQVTAIDADGIVVRQESMELATAGQTRLLRLLLHEGAREADGTR